MSILFGPAGNSDSFYAQGHKHSVEAPQWLKSQGLGAWEYSFGRSINLKEETASAIGEAAREAGIQMSVHAPYYINFGNELEEKRQGSREYLAQSARLAQLMGAKRVVFHPGSCAKISRDKAFGLLKDEIALLSRELFPLYPEITFCPETMGKKNTLGTVEEILQICTLSDQLLPTLDMGHINSLTQGSIREEADYERIFIRMDEILGTERANRAHIHFSHIQYGPSGEIKHLTFEDTQYGPFFEPLAQVLAKRYARNVIICESDGVMAEDALTMQKLYKLAAQALA